MNEGEPLFALETDKVSKDIVAEKSGVLETKVPEGQEVKIGEVVAVITIRSRPRNKERKKNQKRKTLKQRRKNLSRRKSPKPSLQASTVANPSDEPRRNTLARSPPD